MDRQYIINTGTIERTDIVRASDGVKSTFVPDPASGCKYHVILLTRMRILIETNTALAKNATYKQ